MRVRLLCWMFPAILLVVSGHPAFSQQRTRQAGGAFDRFDRNGDGKITRDEYSGPLFEEVDRDRDGLVSREEVRAYYAGRRASQQPAASPTAAAPASKGAFEVVDAVFELCAHDVEAVTRFYRDGIGMREVELAVAEKGVLLEWAGSYLRIRPASSARGEPAAASGPGGLMKQMLASNGYRWFSLWFQNPAAVQERIVKAGYEQPTQGGNVSMIRDPEGNIVEIMRIPRGASAETFTWGMAVSDEAQVLRFYREKLGLPEFEPWNLPPPYSMKMFLFQTGAGRIKFSAPPGQRPRDADAGQEAPGLRSVTLRVADLKTARELLTKNGATFEGETRLLVADPDGNRIYIEAAPTEAVERAKTRAGSGDASRRGAEAGQRSPELGSDWQQVRTRLLADAPFPAPHKEEIAEHRSGEPPLKKMPEGDATQDAAGRGQLFESISVPGITDFQEGMNGFAVADLNHDGLADVVATFSPPRGTGQRFGPGEKLAVFINRGDFRFEPHAVTLLDTKQTMDNFGRGQVPVLADFNRDGFLDLFVTRHAAMSGGVSRPGVESVGNSLFVTDGAWDRFRDVSDKMGIRNELAYNRQPTFGDVNRDGWLDIAIGCDNIKNAQGGFPHSRLYVYRPSGERFEDGRYEDIGGTELIPDFGGFYHDSAKDKAGPDINLYDLDNDGDLDLVQAYHVDVMDLEAPYTPVEYRQGVFCWKNLLVETGEFRFEKVTGNGLACEARLRYDHQTKTLEPEGRAPGLPYVSFADTDNDGDLDVLAVGPGMPGWAPRTEYAGGRFWRNLGGFRFEEATDAVGLTPVTWTYGQWMKFFDAPIQSRPLARANPGERKPYYSDAVFGDFDNDGWQDVVVLDRSESANIATRAALFLNKGDGTFDLKPTTFSGLDAGGICGEAADLNSDGLLDLVFASDPDNSGLALSMERYESRVYWNTGLHGARQNHWLRLRFSGTTDAELIGARVEAREPASGKLLGTRWIHPNHSYKSGGALDAHFGLGKTTSVDVKVALPSGKQFSLGDVKTNQFAELNLKTNTLAEVH